MAATYAAASNCPARVGALLRGLSRRAKLAAIKAADRPRTKMVEGPPVVAAAACVDQMSL
jgi:hypothetical protein